MNYYGLDWLIIILTFIITLGAQAYINSTYRRMKNVKSKCGMVGADVARKILDSNGLENVKVVETGGVLSDHYENKEKVFKKKYGIKVFLPVAKNYGFSHYDDFGNSRSYGYKRIHLGNDLMGQIGTPIVAVESGIVEACRLESIWWLEGRNKKL